MKQVLHDWDDLRASAILRNCRKTMKTSAKLLIAELIIPEAGPGALLGSLLYLQMLVVHGGRERAKNEFVTLLRDSSYKLQRVIATPTPIGLGSGFAKVLAKFGNFEVTDSVLIRSQC
jgi:hypothetical protein